MKYEYTDGETQFEGYFVLDKKQKERRPCVLIAHAWDGPNSYFNAQADLWAAKGFAAFAIDVYGKGIRGKIDGDNGHLMNPLLENRILLRNRLLAAFAEAQNHPLIDSKRITIIGPCFGGLCALDLARAAPKGLLGAIALHSPLSAPNISGQQEITASILLLHGWEDPVAKPENFFQFTQEMTAAGADWQAHVYGHAKHAFTFVGADIPALGIKYDAKAHNRSIKAIDNFLHEIFRKV